MTGNALARAFLDSVAGYSDNPDGATPSQDKPVKLATVDPSFSGSGRPMVLFDGETLMGVKTYPWSGLPPRAGDRVVMLPQGHSYVIIGSLDTVPGSDIPVGTSLDGHWTTAPIGFLLESGAVVLRADYPELYAVIGTRYNTGGETGAQFRLPDSRGTTPVNKSASGLFGTLGDKVGAETHTLTVAQLPPHAPQLWGRYGGGGGGGSGIIAGGTAISAVAGETINASAALRNVGSGQAHNIVQPSMVYTRVVKY